jgi:hypothetical protein
MAKQDMVMRLLRLHCGEALKGIYVRVQRNATWQNLQMDALTDQELIQFAADQPPEAGWRWAIQLAECIRETVGEEEAYE